MQGNAKVIDLLNQLLTNELTSANQYLAHAGLCRRWGYHHLDEHIHAEVEDERQHADKLVKRINFLGGTCDVQRLNKVNVGNTVKQQLELDLQLEHNAVKLMNDCIEECRALGDHGTFSLIIELLTSEEEHVDWLEAQLDQIRQLGEQMYLAQQIK
jgi:bacterioferritin